MSVRPFLLRKRTPDTGRTVEQWLVIDSEVMEMGLGMGKDNMSTREVKR